MDSAKNKTRALLLRSAKCAALIGVSGFAIFKVVSSKILDYLDAYQAELTSTELLLTQFNRSRHQAKELSASFFPEIHQTLADRYGDIDVLLAKLHSPEIAEVEDVDEARAVKLKIWNEIKVLVISKLISYIYGTSLLSALIASQMAIIGRYMYVRGLLKKDGIDPNKYKPGLEDVALVAKYVLLISSRFTQHGLPIIDEAIRRSTEMVLARVDIQDELSKECLEGHLRSIRHEIEDAAGRSLLEETIFSHDALLYVFSPLQPAHRPLANGIVETLKDTFASASFKVTLSNLVKQKIEAALIASCEELYEHAEDANCTPPILLSIIPNIHGELNGNGNGSCGAAPEIHDDAHLTALMAHIFKSTKI